MISTQLLPLCLLLALETRADDADPVVVPLRFEECEPCSVSQVFQFAPATDPVPPRVIAAAGHERAGRASGNVAVRVRRLEQAATRYRVWIDGNANDDPSDDAPFDLSPGEARRIDVSFKHDRSRRYPFSVTLQSPERGDDTAEVISWTPLYRAVGSLPGDEGELPICVLNVNADGRFGGELGHATCIGIDFDHDGRFRGEQELYVGSEVIGIGAEQYLVKSIASDGSSLALLACDLPIPVLGQPMPSYRLPTIGATSIDLGGARPKLLIVDFWDSRCAPCIAHMPEVKQLSSEPGLEAVYVSLDDARGAAKARAVGEQQGLAPATLVITGHGALDPWTRAIGSTSITETLTMLPAGNQVTHTRRCGNPLGTYLLIDTSGVLRYIGSGGAGSDLADLRAAVAEARRRH